MFLSTASSTESTLLSPSSIQFEEASSGVLEAPRSRSTKKNLYSFTELQIAQIANAILKKHNLPDALQKTVQRLREETKIIDSRATHEIYIQLIKRVFVRIISCDESATNVNPLTKNEKEVAGVEFLIREYHYVSTGHSNCKNHVFRFIKDALIGHAQSLKQVLDEESALDDSLQKIKSQAEFILKPRFLSDRKDGIFFNTRFSQLLGGSIGKMATSSGALTAVLAGYTSIQVGIYYIYNELPQPAAINIVIGGTIIGSQLYRAAKAAWQGNYEML